MLVAAACSGCGKAMPAGAKFCPECGVKAGATLASCPSCKAEVPVTAKFCLGCGSKI